MPPLVPEKMNPLLELFSDATITTTYPYAMSSPTDSVDGSSLVPTATNPHVTFVSRCIAYFHSTHPGAELQTLTLPIEQLPNKPRLGLDGHEIEDLALAEQLHAAEQRYEEFRLENSSDDDEDQVCVFCNGAHRPDVLLLCDCCDLGFHTFCLDPPLTQVPPGDWFCPGCIDEVTREIEAEESQPITNPTSTSSDPHQRERQCPFWGGPSQLGSAASTSALMTPPRNRTRRADDPRRSADRSDKRSRLRIFIRRTLERRRLGLSETDQAWSRPVPNNRRSSTTTTASSSTTTAAAAASSSATSSSSSSRLLPHVRWSNSSRASSSSFNSLSALFGPSASAHYIPPSQRVAEPDESEQEIDYDAYGYPKSPSSKRARKKSTKVRVKSNQRKPSLTKSTKRRRIQVSDEEDDDEEQAAGEFGNSSNDDDGDDDGDDKEHLRRSKSRPSSPSKSASSSSTSSRSKKSSKSSKSSSRSSDPFDFDGATDVPNSAVTPVSASSSRSRSTKSSARSRDVIVIASPDTKSSNSQTRTKRRRKRCRVTKEDDLDGFIQYDDTLLPATPSSDSDGTKAAWLPTQPNNKASRREKLMKRNEATAQAARLYREKIMNSKRAFQSESESESESQSESDGKSGSMSESGSPSDSSMSSNASVVSSSSSVTSDNDSDPSPPRHRRCRLIKKTRTDAASSDSPRSRPSKLARSHIGTSSPSTIGASDASEESDDFLEDISSFEATQEKKAKRQYVIEQMITTKAAAAASASSSSSSSSSLARLSSPFKQKSSDSSSTKNNSHSTAAKSYRLPLQSVSTGKKSSKRHSSSSSSSSSRSSHVVDLAELNSDSGLDSSVSATASATAASVSVSSHSTMNDSSDSLDRPRSTTPPPSPGRAKSKFRKQQLSHFNRYQADVDDIEHMLIDATPTPVASKFFARPSMTPIDRLSLGTPLRIPETPASDNDPTTTLPTSSPNSPEEENGHRAQSNRTTTDENAHHSTLNRTPSTLVSKRLGSMFAAYSTTPNSYKRKAR